MNLWDIPHSRTSDPLSSFKAGDRHHLSGKAESHRKQILEFMRGKRPMYPIIANLIIVIVPPLLLCWAGRRAK